MGNNHFKGIKILQAIPSNTNNQMMALAIKEEQYLLCKFELDPNYLLSKCVIPRKTMDRNSTQRPPNRLQVGPQGTIHLRFGPNQKEKGAADLRF